AGNTGSSADTADVSGTFISKGYNLIGAVDATGNGFSTATHDQFGTADAPLDAQLDALADNGGPTPTMALRSNSPALGSGNPSNAPYTDQRGVPRPQQGAIDIGAFEATPPVGPTLSPSPAKLPATTVGVPYSQTITASPGTQTVTGQFTSAANGLSF